MADLSSLRSDIMQSLASLPANLYDHTPEVPMLPAIVLLPGDPYIELKAFAPGFYQANFEVRIAVNSIDNAAGLVALEELALGVFEGLPGYVKPVEVSQPNPLTLGMAEVIACTIPVYVQFSTQE